MKNSINNTIKNHCQKNQISITSLASKINYTRTSLYALLRRSDMSVSTLSAISQALKHNFFQYLWSDKTIISKQQAISLQNENAQLKTQITQLSKQIELLQKLLSNNK